MRKVRNSPRLEKLAQAVTNGSRGGSCGRVFPMIENSLLKEDVNSFLSTLLAEVSGVFCLFHSDN